LLKGNVQNISVQNASVTDLIGCSSDTHELCR